MKRRDLLVPTVCLLLGTILLLDISGETSKNCSVQNSAQFPALHGKGERVQESIVLCV